MIGGRELSHVSFIIPAYNEAGVLGNTLESVFRAARANNLSFEVIVVDDASTDSTAAIAERAGAIVIRVSLRQIAAVRNAGARRATGDVFIFVDADTMISEATVRAAMNALNGGAVGGGAMVKFDNGVSVLAKLLTAKVMIVFRILGLAAGCFIYCRRDAFEAIGGFDERYFASEEIWLSKSLKSRGRFIIVQPAVITSGRKVRMYGLAGLLWRSICIAIKGTKGVQQREGLDVWYDGRRETPVHRTGNEV